MSIITQPTFTHAVIHPSTPLDRPFCLFGRWVQHLSPGVGDLPQPPWLFRDDREVPCRFVSQFSQHPQIQPTGSHRLGRVEFSQLVHAAVLIHCWYLSSLNSFSKQRGPGDPADEDQVGIFCKLFDVYNDYATSRYMQQLLSHMEHLLYLYIFR